MKKTTINTAYHEAGHIVALLLTNKRFKYVTINPGKGEKVNDPGTLGHVKGIPLKNKYQWEIISFFDPAVFNKYFFSNFISVAGLVAEKIYTGRFNNIGASGDFRNWAEVTLFDLPEKFSLSYQRFLLAYTKEVLEIKVNWLHITFIAEALLERKTLNYDEVRDVIWKRMNMEMKNK